MQEELDRVKAENDHLRKLLDINKTRNHKKSISKIQDNVAAQASPNSGEARITCSRNSYSWEPGSHDLNKDQIARYSRQLILPSFGAAAQSRLCKAAVLVIGAGGLGCPAVLYLAAAGVGRLGIVDKDAVELSNLHRQIAHRQASVGMHKADSAADACRALNSSIQVYAYREGFTPANALEMLSAYDVVVDATDNAASRYLISDACVVAQKPLVSGAALGTDGQLTVYNHGLDGPCYRCLFPEAPRPESCSRCSDAGVLGVVPGIIGTLQALEAIKLASGVGKPLSRTMLLVDSLSGCFTSIKLRAKMVGCAACGEKPSITAESLPQYDYSAFTGAPSNDAAPQPLGLLQRDERISAEQLQQLLSEWPEMVLIDVRPKEQFQIAHMPGSSNYPFDENKKEAFLDHVDSIRQQVECAICSSTCSEDSLSQQQRSASAGTQQEPLVCVVCRRGNDSQQVVQMLKQRGLRTAVDLIGGLEAWSQNASVEFPEY